MALEAYIGSILPYASPNRIPRNYAECKGAYIKVQDFPGLFSLIGSHYGGDGRTSFQTPNLSDRVAIGESRGSPAPEITPRGIAQTTGSWTVRLHAWNLPAHTHDANGKTDVQPATTETNATSSVDTTPQFSVESILHASSTEANIYSPSMGLRIGASPSSPIYVDSAANIQLGQDMPPTTVKMTIPPTVTTKVNPEVMIPSRKVTIQTTDTGSGVCFSILQPICTMHYCICTEGKYPPFN